MGFWSGLKDRLKSIGRTIRAIVAVPVGIATGIVGAALGTVAGGIRGAVKGNILKGIKSGFLEGASLGGYAFNKVAGEKVFNRKQANKQANKQTSKQVSPRNKVVVKSNVKKIDIRQLNEQIADIKKAREDYAKLGPKWKEEIENDSNFSNKGLEDFKSSILEGKRSPGLMSMLKKSLDDRIKRAIEVKKIQIKIAEAKEHGYKDDFKLTPKDGMRILKKSLGLSLGLMKNQKQGLKRKLSVDDDLAVDNGQLGYRAMNNQRNKAGLAGLDRKDDLDGVISRNVEINHVKSLKSKIKKSQKVTESFNKGMTNKEKTGHTKGKDENTIGG